MKGVILFFSAVCFLVLFNENVLASRSFSVSAGFGWSVIEAAVQETPVAETESDDTEVEQALFGMVYCMASEQYSVEAVYAVGTDLIDIPEPGVCAALGIVCFLLYRKLNHISRVKEI